MTLGGIPPLGNVANPVWKYVEKLEEEERAMVGSCGLLISEMGSRYGGCVRVGERWLLTAHHVVDASELAFRFKAVFGFFGRNSRKFTYALDPADFFSSADGIQGAAGYEFDLDYAFIRLAGTAQAGDPSLERHPRSAPGDPARQTAARIPQHRSRGAMQLATEHSIEDPNAGLIVDFDADYLFHRSSTYPGTSGSPIFDTDWNLVALHTHGFRASSPDDRKTRNNWGARITRIVADARSRQFAYLHEMPALAGL